jgi:hypothetical protein
MASRPKALRQDRAGGVVKVRPLHRSFRERGGQLCDGVPGKPRCNQRGDDDSMGMQVTAGAEVRVEHTFQESKRPGEPGCLGEISELPPGECLYPDPFAVRGGKIAGEAATQMVAGLVVIYPGWVDDVELASDGLGDVRRRPWRRNVTGHDISEALTCRCVSVDLRSRPTRSSASSSAAENPGCFSLSSLRTYSLFCVLCWLITFTIVVFLTS